MAKSRPEAAMRALAVAFVLALCTAPLQAQQQSGANPTAESVHEQQLLQELGKLQGRITVPDQKAATLEQPQGRLYQTFHERMLPWGGAIAILGVTAVIAAFYLWRGRIRLRADERSDRTVTRFGAFERFTHWMTASSFIVLALTGLNYFFGKRLLLPLLGPDAFAAWSHWAKYAHNFISWPFMLGVLIMIVIWIRDNLPDRYDVAWLKAGGGLFGGAEPPAGRFNAGQKLVFWSVTVFGTTLGATGLSMLFPFSVFDINGMQIAQYVHSTVGVIFIAVIIGHIYIGTLGMEGAFDAMWSGQVGIGWARQHHRAWVEKGRAERGRSASAPAE